MRENDSKKSKFAQVERIIFWIGSCFGIVLTVLSIFLAVFALKGEFTKPKPPDLEVKFSLTETAFLAFVPSLYFPGDRETIKPFVVGLRVTNVGGTTAKEAELKLLLSKNLRIRSHKMPIQEDMVHTGGSAQQMVTVPLGTLSPRETKYLDYELEAFFGGIRLVAWGVSVNGVSVRYPSSNGTPPVLWSLLKIEAKVSAENMQEKNISMSILVGGRDVLKNQGPLRIKGQGAVKPLFFQYGKGLYTEETFDLIAKQESNQPASPNVLR